MKTSNSKLKRIVRVKKYIPIGVSLIILIVGLLNTFLILNYFKQEEESQSQKMFVHKCKDINSKISSRINLQTEFLLGGSNLFEASETVTRSEWKRYNKFSKGNIKFNGVQALGYAPIIKNKKLKNHIAGIRKEGFPKYTVFPMGNRAFYTPIIYIEPFAGRNPLAFGFDMFSDPIRRKAMELARDKNIPILSGKVKLILESKTNVQVGTVLYIPVYKTDSLPNITVRREAITGWVFCAFIIDDLVYSILGENYFEKQKNIQIQIYENANLSPESLLFDSHTNKNLNSEGFKKRTQTQSVQLNDKKWTVVFTQFTADSLYYSRETIFILLGGIAISLLLFALSYSLLLTKKRARIIAKRLSSDILKKNRKFEQMNSTLEKNYKKLISSKERLFDANQELKKAKIKAEESDQLKTAFLANMSHEIRTPMNGILGFTELLKSESTNPEEQKYYLEIIEKSGNRLLNIINDIIDISKIEAGQMKLSYSQTNLDQQMQYIYNFFKPEVENKGLKLVLIKSLTNEETIIYTDAEKLYATLINLVKNAIKYTVQGSIEFGYELQGDYIRFFVKDTGIGIAKEKQKSIFERFIQAELEDKMARQGAGLGLSIAKAYVELLSGKIGVESEPNVGSTFYFTIPDNVHYENNDDLLNVSAPVDCEIKNLKILVAEDDTISRKLIKKILERYSLQILSAKNGLEAVELCRNNPDIDLIFMDMQMPLMNGYEATQEIRKFNSTVVIFAQTAFALEGDKAKTLEAGCNGYISKPIKKEELSLLMKHFFC